MRLYASLFVNKKIPTIHLNYSKGFASSIKGYEFDKFEARISQAIDISNKGNFKYNFKGGTFLGSAENIAFMDYHHFNGNQLRIAHGNTMDRFNNLPYYRLSTIKNYSELHVEHNFQGFILNKIPLVKHLNFNLIMGVHALAAKNQNPYQEFSIGMNNIGWGKFRFLRVDYIRSYQSGFSSDVFVFGLSF